MRPIALAAGACACLAAAKVAGDVAVRCYEDLPLERTVPPGATATVDGLRVHYLDQGAGPAVVLLHGLGASTFAFRENIPALAARFRVVAVDLPGHGLSSREAPDMSLSAQARYVIGLIDQLAVGRAVIVGHSMGGGVAQRIALARPSRVAGLVLIASITDRTFKRAGAASALLAPFIPLFATAVLHSRFVRPLWSRAAVADPTHLTPEVIAGYVAPGHVRGSVAGYQRLMMDRLRDPDIDPAAIAAATLLIWGDTDRIVSIENGRALAAAVPGSELVVVPRAGHWVQEEQPEEVNRLIADFAARCFADGAERPAAAPRRPARSPGGQASRPPPSSPR
jgi:pimeloyl-ACP methyl ester carboxylesterase